MALEVEPATFGVFNDYVSGFLVRISGSFNQSGQKNLILYKFSWKMLKFEILSRNFGQQN